MFKEIGVTNKLSNHTGPSFCDTTSRSSQLKNTYFFIERHATMMQRYKVQIYTTRKQAPKRKEYYPKANTPNPKKQNV